MTNHCIDLECARPTIVPIILGHLPPACKRTKCNPSYHHDNRRYSGKYEPTETDSACNSCNPSTPSASGSPCQSSTKLRLYVICAHTSPSMYMDGRYIRGGGGTAAWNTRLRSMIGRS